VNGLLTKKDMAKMFRVSEKTIDKLRKEGMPHHMVGGSVRFEKEKAMQWLEENKRHDGTKELSRESYPEVIRAPIIKAFDAATANNNEWWQNFQSPDDALKSLGRLWKCPDIVPGKTVEQASKWLQSKRHEELGRFYTYARFVRHLRPVLLAVINALENKDQ